MAARSNAKKQGRLMYQGDQCSKGHIGRRYTSTGKCVDCERGKNAGRVQLMREAKARGPIKWMTAMTRRYKYFVAIPGEIRAPYMPELGHPRAEWHDKAFCAHAGVRAVGQPDTCKACDDMAARAAKRKQKAVETTKDPLDI